MERLRTAVVASELNQMLETWNFLQDNIFKRIEPSKQAAITTFKHELYRWYLATAAQAKRHDKITEFFDTLAGQLQSLQEWRDWFSKIIDICVFYCTISYFIVHCHTCVIVYLQQV